MGGGGSVELSLELIVGDVTSCRFLGEGVGGGVSISSPGSDSVEDVSGVSWRSAFILSGLLQL